MCKTLESESACEWRKQAKHIWPHKSEQVEWIVGSMVPFYRTIEDHHGELDSPDDEQHLDNMTTLEMWKRQISQAMQNFRRRKFDVPHSKVIYNPPCCEEGAPALNKDC